MLDTNKKIIFYLEVLLSFKKSLVLEFHLKSKKNVFINRANFLFPFQRDFI